MNKDLIISKNTSLLDALTIMDRINRKLLIICDEEKFVGVISIGDIQRAIIKKKDLASFVKNFGRNTITYATVDDNLESIKDEMRTKRIESMPIIDKNNNLVDIIEWNQLFEEDNTFDLQIDMPIIIMAGGKGTRLLPLTNVIPKPLIPISDKTIIEEIMCKFKKSGCNKFYISVNYMMNEIEKYFSSKEWDIEFIREDKPLGTGGSLYYLNKKIKDTFIVVNCDTIVNINLNDLVKYHKENKNDITVVSAVKKFHIPYGTIETKKDGIINKIIEKPDYVYQVNVGLYIFEPLVFEYIEKDTFINITDLIDKAIKRGNRVGAFPIAENAWTDMGNWDEYLKAVNKYLEEKN